MKERAVAFRSCPWSTSATARRRARAPSEAYACACCSKIRPAPTMPIPKVVRMIVGSLFGNGRLLRQDDDAFELTLEARHPVLPFVKVVRIAEQLHTHVPV